MSEHRPTPEAYSELQQAFDHFNSQLFEGALPPCLITLQREKRTFGYFSDARFVRRSGEKTDEIAMNPQFFAVRSVRETLSTLAHEMVHQWQFHSGMPGRRGYHNREWAAKMEEIGLMPSSTGQPGGKRVGERVTHYIAVGGRFDVSCAALMTPGFQLSWVDRFPAARPRPVPAAGGGDGDEGEGTPGGDESGAGSGGGSDVEDLSDLVELPPEQPVNRSNRVKYRCANCGVQVWGKPNLRVLCGGEDCAAAAFDMV